MPTNTGAAFVVIQHLSPDHESMMVSLLSRNTPMPVAQAVNGQALEADHVYLISPGTLLGVSDGRLVVELRDPDVREVPKPIDHFFATLAEDFGSKSVGIVLSGTGSDGTSGIEQIHKVGGLTLAQDRSAAFGGMPAAAIETGLIDATMDPTALAGAVVRFAETGQRPGTTEDLRTLEPDEERILSYLAQTTDIDFREYKTATIRRRLERRMGIAGHETLADYSEFVRTSEVERQQLAEDLFIDVTEFFRDRPAFDLLAEDIIPDLVKQAAEEERPFRMWVPGCATGEEAYSLTMLAVEAAEKLPGIQPLIQTFATDLHGAALEKAGRGRYPASRMGGLSQDRIERFFDEVDGEYVVSQQLRSMLTFARHSLLSDPPFTRVDLISCRNLLIYFRTAAQERSISSMSFALRQGGVLFLGPSETLGFAAPDYAPIDPTWRLWRKEFDYIERKYRRKPPPRPDLSFPVSAIPNPDHNVLRAYDALLQEQFSAAILLNDRREVIYVMGDGKRWLEYPSGRPSNDVMSLLSDTNLRLAVGAALRELEGGAPTSTPRPLVETLSPRTNEEAGTTPTALVGKRVDTGHKQPYYLLYTTAAILPVVIDEPAQLESDATRASDSQVVALELELRHTRDSLQSLLEEQEVSNEELNATNEELIAANEELQSTNEELSSVNEELRTLNDEHQRRIDQVLELSADLEQLMSSTEIAVVFLAEDETVRRFNDPARQYFRVRDTDLGRPFADLSTSLLYPELPNDIAGAFESGRSVSRTIRNQNRPHQRLVAQVSPYELRQHRSGVLIALIDVTELQTIEEERLLAGALSGLHACFAVWDPQHRWAYANRVLGMPDLRAESVIGQTLADVYGPDAAAVMEQENRDILQSGQPMQAVRTVGNEEVFLVKYPASVDGEPFVAGIAFGTSDFADAGWVQQVRNDTANSGGADAALRARIAELEAEVERLRQS